MSVQPSKRLRSASGKPVPRKTRLEILVETFGDVMEEIWEGVMEAVDKSDLPATKDDEDESAFTNFILFLNDHLFNKVKVVSDSDESEEEAEESSEEESASYEMTEESSDSKISVYTDSEQEEPVSESEEDESDCHCDDDCPDDCPCGRDCHFTEDEEEDEDEDEEEYESA